MAKRGLPEEEEESSSKAPFGQRQTDKDERDVEMGEFEDPWEDEVEEDEQVVDGAEQEEEEEDDEDEEMRDVDVGEVYLPNKPVDKDHVLVPDMSTYEMLHSMSVQWPFLSFDIIKDQFGDERRNVRLQFDKANCSSIHRRCTW